MTPLLGAADLLVRSTLLIALAWLLTAVLRRRGGSASLRHMVWLLCFAGLMLLPVLHALAPPLAVPILPAAAPQAGGAEAVPAAAAGLAPWIAYLAVASLLGARLLAGQHVLRLRWGRARAEGRISGHAAALAKSLDIRRRVEVRLDDRPVMPMTWGWIVPKILLPSEAAAWPEERLRVVLLHELAHVSRFDSPARAAASLACALYWLHPGVWFARRRLVMEQEHASDDLVLRAGTAPRLYARSLLEIACTLDTPRTARLAPAMAGGSALEHRIRAIIGTGGRGAPGRAATLASAGSALIATLLVTTAVPVQADAPDVARAAPVQPPLPTPQPVADRPAARAAPVRLAQNEAKHVVTAEAAGPDHPREDTRHRALPPLPPLRPLPPLPPIPPFRRSRP